MTGMSRRTLLLGGLGLGAAALTGCTSAPAAGHVPSASGPMPTLPPATPRPGQRIVEQVLTAKPVTLDLGGPTVPTWAYGDTAPGPLVRLRDLVNRGKVTVENPPSLTLITPPPRSPSDGTTDEDPLVGSIQRFNDFGSTPAELAAVRGILAATGGIAVTYSFAESVASLEINRRVVSRKALTLSGEPEARRASVSLVPMVRIVARGRTPTRIRLRLSAKIGAVAPIPAFTVGNPHRDGR